MSVTGNSAEDHNFSIVIPTFQEAKNISVLIKRIAAIDFGTRAFEVILSDDNSQDGTDEVVQLLTAQYPWLRLLKRRGEKDLSQSVIDGIRKTHYPICVTLDADLSHPPEKIPDMLAALEKPNIDLIIGSRYIKGGSSDELWPLSRLWLSRAAAMLARLLLAVPAKDPLSGFLVFRKKTFFSGAPLEPIGWKLGLEFIIKCRCKNITEIPIHFAERVAGTSKVNLAVGINYIKHLQRLIWFKLFAS